VLGWQEEMLERQRRLQERLRSWEGKGKDTQRGPSHEQKETRGSSHEAWRESSKPFQILALDGGGVRGVFTAAILERLCLARPTLLDEV
jgi:hypothetical protein